MSLLSALYTGVSGLQSFGDAIQVIGDNIANVNTMGFKSSRAEFSDLISQTINAESGRSQMGRGVSMSAITTSFQQGSFSNTDRLSDLAINGNGFFIVNDGNRDYYTRQGQFTMDNQGNLVTQAGYNLIGYQYNEKGEPQGTLGPISLAKSTTQPAVTTEVDIRMNLDSREQTNTFDPDNAAATSNFSTSITVYDSLGGAHPMTIYFNKTNDLTWEWHAMMDGGELSGGTPGDHVEGGNGTFTFDASGALDSITPTSSPITGTTDGVEAVFNFTGSDQSIKFDFGSTKNDIPTGTGGTGLDGTSQFAQSNVINSQTQDGFAAGSLAGVDINEDGIISGIYTNGRTLPIGQVALANFANLQGLFKTGSGIYVDTSDSGVPVVSSPNVGGYGTINSFTLELSNVDLATEFVNLITTQRAYQANSKIITVGDQLLSEIVNIMR